MRCWWRGLDGLLLVIVWLWSGLPASAMSPLNLSPGYPTSLDDAYPVPKGDWVLQSGARMERLGTAWRLRAPADIRWGIWNNLEVSLGTTPLRGPLTPGSTDDPRAVRFGGLARFYHEDTVSLATRIETEVPYLGQRTRPAFRGTLLGSWEFSPRRYWHVNAGYEAAPSSQVGQWPVGGTSQWSAVTGVVWGLARWQSAAIADVRVAEVPTKQRELLVTPEIGWVVPIVMEHLHLQVSMSRDFGAAPSTIASFRGWLGLSLIF